MQQLAEAIDADLTGIIAGYEAAEADDAIALRRRPQGLLHALTASDTKSTTSSSDTAVYSGTLTVPNWDGTSRRLLFSLGSELSASAVPASARLRVIISISRVSMSAPLSYVTGVGTMSTFSQEIQTFAPGDYAYQIMLARTSGTGSVSAGTTTLLITDLGAA